jgi:glycolate oxidase iron-sulfur subunit
LRHEIPVEALGARGPAMAAAVESCVHCGFCLPACPTYLTLGEEMDSPRGRIVLMKGVLEGELSLDEVGPHIDRCLGCLSCVSACPSGVRYGELLTPFREMEQGRRRAGLARRLTRSVARRTLPYPGRFRVAARLGTLARPFRRVLPRPLRAMLDLLPERIPPADRLPAVHAAKGPRRARVALLAGCAQQVLAPEINRATLRVLARNGVEVVVPERQGCCGALAMHVGGGVQARRLARANFHAFDLDSVDAVVTNAAGCGSGIHEYPLLFAGTGDEETAARFAERVRDVSVLLADVGLEPPPALPEPLLAAYHDACHLAHGQGIRAEPRALLRTIPNLTLAPLPEPDICCGSAGTYNLEHPAIASSLGDRKAAGILASGASLVVTGNIGCMTQIASSLERNGKGLPVLHTMELLDRAYRGEIQPVAHAAEHHAEPS